MLTEKSVWAVAEFQREAGILNQWQTSGCLRGRAQFAVLKKEVLSEVKHIDKDKDDKDNSSSN